MGGGGAGYLPRMTAPGHEPDEITTGKPGGEEDETTPTPADRPSGDRISDVGDNLMPEDVRQETREQEDQKRSTDS